MLRELPIPPQDDRNERLTAVIGAGRKPPAVIFVLTEGSAMQMMAGPFRQSARNLACFINGRTSLAKIRRQNRGAPLVCDPANTRVLLPAAT
jgi:hypothetical protein